MQNKNDITLEKHGAVMLLDIEGDITAFSEPFLNEAYKDANDQGAGKICCADAKFRGTPKAK